MMFLGSLVLWVGVPVAWLWIGSRLQNATSLATAIGAMMVGMLLSITLLLGVLGRLSRRHTELQERRGVPEGETTALELVLVVERRRRGDRLLRVVLRLQRLEPDTAEHQLLSTRSRTGRGSAPRPRPRQVAARCDCAREVCAFAESNAASVSR